MRGGHDGKPGPKTRAFVGFALRRGPLLWAIALLLAVPATWRTAQLYLHLKGDLEELLPRKAPSVLAIDELRTRMPGLQFLGVVVDTGTPDKLPAGEKLVDDLAARIRAYPADLVRAVNTGSVEERKFLEKHSALYVDVKDLQTIRTRIEARRDYEVSKETGVSLDDEDAPPLDFTDIENKYKALTPSSGKTERDRYSSTELHTTLLLVEVGGFASSAKKSSDLLARVKGDLANLGGPEHYAPGMRVGYSGDVAISVEELSALVADLSTSSIVVLFAVVLAIIVYYRWWKSVVLLGAPLMLAAVYSFALASLLPFGAAIDSLNSNTAFLGSIIVGNGINFGIVLLARYVEERRSGHTVEESLVIAIAGTRIGTLAAAMAAGVSYASLVITQFRGFRQFGIIGGIGMGMAWLTAFLLMPSLAAWLERKPNSAPPAKREDARWMAHFAQLVVRYHRAFAIVFALATVAAAYEVHKFNANEIEYDFSKLRRADTWTNGEGYWGRKMDALLGQYLTPTVILTDSVDEARAVEARLREEMKHPPLSDMVSNVRTIDDVLPLDQPAKIAEATIIREEMTPNMRSLVAPDKKEAMDRLLGDEAPTEVALEALPRRFTTAMRERDGSIGRTVLVFPRPSKQLWEGPPLEAFTRALRRVAEVTTEHGGRPARVAGSLPLSTDILGSIKHDGPLASACALLMVMLVVVLLFRWRSTTLYVIGALIVGVLWLAGLTMAFGVKINFANFIAFPITFGIGVDYSVNVMSRYESNHGKDGSVAEAITSTGSAVALCSVTTIIGYSSLLLAENRALFLFGVLAVLGEVSCLTAALTLMPAIRQWRNERPRAPTPTPPVATA